MTEGSAADMDDVTSIRYEVVDRVATITIDRPE
jgi:hypothetical protein